MTPPAVIDLGPRKGIPLVCLHGFLGCAEDWRTLIDALSAQRRCLAFDLPGHGEHPEPIRPGPTSFDAGVACVAARLDALGLPCADLLGYSLGGRLAYGLVACAPERIRRAVIVGGSPGIDDELARRTRKRDDDFRARTLERGPLAAWVDAWYAQPLFASLAQTPGYEVLRARRLRGRPAALAEALRALSPGIQPPLRHRLMQSAVPLLLVAGALDTKYAALNRTLAAARPQTRAVIIEGAGHAPHLEKPDVFLTALREFLADA